MMKKCLLYRGLVGLVLLALAMPIEAGVPGLIHYQGKLTHSGSPVTGNQEVGFKIFDAASQGNCLWEGTYTVSCSNGIFSVLLGSGTYTINPSVLIDKDALYMEIVVGGISLLPRQRLASTVFSFMAEQAGTATKALTAERLDGKEAGELSVGTATFALQSGTATMALNSQKLEGKSAAGLEVGTARNKKI